MCSRHHANVFSHATNLGMLLFSSAHASDSSFGTPKPPTPSTPAGAAPADSWRLCRQLQETSPAKTPAALPGRQCLGRKSGDAKSNREPGLHADAAEKQRPVFQADPTRGLCTNTRVRGSFSERESRDPCPSRGYWPCIGCAALALIRLPSQADYSWATIAATDFGSLSAWSALIQSGVTTAICQSGWLGPECRPFRELRLKPGE
jgi:hypothetical protein